MSQQFASPDPANNDAPATKTRPDLRVPGPDPGSKLRGLSRMVGINFLLLLIALGLSGYVAYRQFQPPAAPGKGGDDSAKSSTDSAKPEVDRLQAEIQALTKKLDERPSTPDVSPQIPLLEQKIADLGKTVAELPNRLDLLNQKVDAARQGDSPSSAPRLDAIEKRLGSLAALVDSIKTALPARATAGKPPATGAENLSLDQSIDLFKKGKYGEAKAAFAKLQSSTPDDARVWYYSALVSGLATGDWKGESERLVANGVAREKAGTPDRAKIDATFADLTIPTGKDWLAFYRKQAAQ
jgi:TolA-binding protein